MERFLRFCVFLICALLVAPCPARQRVAAPGRLSQYVDPQSYAYMYPYLSNQMRTELNPGTSVNQVNNPVDVIVRTEKMSAPRRVVPRSRRATTQSSARVTPVANTARAATNNGGANTSQRRVVARQSANSARVATNNGGARAAVKQIARTGGTLTTTTTNTGVSYNRCIADYTACMDGYCARENTAYNRCYCSAKLAQIDAQYQNKISDLVTQLIQMQSGTIPFWTAEEMNEYWMETIGNYVGTNSWLDLENALNIEWPSPEERMRGQQVFLTGHQYCSQHLRACAPMASNMRDAYRSQIGRDCATYEATLGKIQNAAETVIENYRD